MERMHRVHQLLANSEYPNSTKLAREFEVTTRTIKRDIEFMRDRLCLPISFDPEQNGFFYEHPVDHFPDVPMSEAEIFALFVANKAIEQYQGTPFHQLLEKAFRRLTGRLDDHVRFSLGNSGDSISFRPLAPGEADLQTFESLAKGVRERRVVSFMYRNHAALKSQLRRVHPYHLAYVDGRWCLFGFDEVRRAMRTFILCRLQKPKLIERHFTVPKRFDLHDYLRHSFSLFRGKDGDDYEVVVDLDAWAADEVRGRRWHATQTLMELPKGMLRITMRLSNVEEVEKWVLGFGTHATVVRPRLLAERLRHTAAELVRRYDVPVERP